VTGTTRISYRDPANRSTRLADHAPQAPNSVAFSCRARREKLSKTNDLAREAVSCNAGLGGSAQISYLALGFEAMQLLVPLAR